MVINAEILKTVNDSIMSSKYMTANQIADLIGLDKGILADIAGDLSQHITSVSVFFDLTDKYVSVLNKRVKMLNECFVTINRWQIEKGLIPQGVKHNGSIIWEDKLTVAD